MGRRLSDPGSGTIRQYGIPYRQIRHDETAVFRRTPRGIFSYMLLSETLWKHLAEIDEECNEMMDRLVRQMAEREGVTEQLKSDDWMLWLQKMNGIRSRAEEVVLHDLVYSL